MQTVSELEVYEAGLITVIGFGGRAVLDNLNLAECRDELVTLIRDHDCSTLAFDLTGVSFLPSGLLGLLASIDRLGVTVQLYNACEEIVEALEITRLNQLFQVHRIEV